MTLLPRLQVLLALVASSTLHDVADALATFANRIPNGHKVPNPGPQGGIWAGVGHYKAGGGGELNPFGQAFAAANFEWTEELCELDSDGDGRSNGQELGDPDCSWIAGEEPALPSLSHPGITDEPLEEPALSTCSEYVDPESVIEYDIKFSQPATVDATRTHYVCEQIEQPVPSSEVLHHIKNAVILDNSDILHHIFVFFCPEGSGDGDRVGQGPYKCSGNEVKCSRFAGWAVGAGEYCFPPNVGAEFDFAETNTMVVKVEAHYDNSLGIPQQDQSGIRLTFTPELRPLIAQSTLLGMGVADNQFELPPLQSNYSLSNICPSEATARRSHPIFVYSFTPHMHYFGRSLFTEHYRCGQKIGEIGRIEAYEFDNQQTYVLDPPVKILPGDALVTTCRYNTIDSVTPIVGGEETTDEMCLNLIGSYPNNNDTGGTSPCVSFTDGISRIPSDAASSSAPVNIALLSSLKFAIAGRGSEGLLLQYESDPTKSWAPCCDDDTCEALFLGDVGDACALDTDCVGDVVCDGGVCAQSVIRSDSSSDTSTSCTLDVLAASVMLVTTILASSW